MFEDWNGFFFGDFFEKLNFMGEGPLITVLNDHDFEVFVGEAFKTLENVGGVDFHHEFGLFLDESFSDKFHGGVG